ncbi:MAG: RDD family protein [Flavobacteriales bacterium]|nr:RDD family protein [Flavobacteriales bacterium]
MEENYNFGAIDQNETHYIDSSKGKRFGGYLIDTVARLVITFVLAFIFPNLFPDEEASYFASLPYDYSLAVLYYWALEASTGQTLGKMILGMRIIKDDGSTPTGLNILGRSFCRLIPFDALSLLISDRAWHDTIPEIRVVDK